MEPKKQWVTGHEYDLLEESIAALPVGMLSIGIGRHLREESGMSGPEIRDLIGTLVPQFADHGSYLCVIGEKPTKCYVIVRGKAIEVGSRRDYEEAGAEIRQMCDELDKKFLAM